MAINSELNTTQHLSAIILCSSVEIHYATNSTATAAWQHVILIFNIFNSLFGTLLNSLVIIAYCRNLRLRTVENTFYMLLAVTDISVTAVLQPIYAAALLKGLLGRWDCLLWDTVLVLHTLCVRASLTTLIILSVHCYITLAYPFRHRNIVTKSRLKVVVVVCSVLIMLPLLLMVWITKILFHISLCVCFILLTYFFVFFTWGWTYKLISRHRRDIKTTQTPAAHKVLKSGKILRSTITAFLVTFSLLGCYSLVLFLGMNRLVGVWKIDHNVSSISFKLSLTLVYFHSLVNPCLVFWRNSDYRETVKKFFT